MTQFVEQLRNQAKWYAQPGHNARDLMDSHLLEKAADEIECLRAKIAEMEKQEPSHWGCTVLQSDGRWKEEVSREAPPEGYFSIRDIFPLYALPGAQSVPDVDAFAQLIREIDGKHQLGAGALAERIVEWLAAAPEAKP